MLSLIVFKKLAFLAIQTTPLSAPVISATSPISLNIVFAISDLAKRLSLNNNSNASVSQDFVPNHKSFP